jgi:branched-chain amino acid transport system permease protein
LLAVALAYYPWFFGTVITEISDTVGLFILMGLGLNIVVGFAGLLDLGYVAFFAIGAYTIGVFTNTSGELAWSFGWTFWMALPMAILVATLAGVLLGVPVLRMRGDYLAIVTLGFGEIIRIMALSDWLKPYIGGSQGIVLIPPPVIDITLPMLGIVNHIAFDTFQKLYYLIVVGILVALFIARRLRDSWADPGKRSGRMKTLPRPWASTWCSPSY